MVTTFWVGVRRHRGRRAKRSISKAATYVSPNGFFSLHALFTLLIPTAMALEHKPGDKVPQSGIYTAIHHSCHSGRHAVTCVRGEQFAACRGSAQTSVS